MNIRIWCYLVVLVVLPGQLQAETVFRFGHILKPSTAHHQNLVWAQEAIKTAFGSRYALEVYPEGMLGKTDLQNVEGFEKGTTNMAYLSFGHLVNLYGQLAIGGGPFVFRDFGHWQAFKQSELFKALVNGFEKQTGMTVLGLAYYGERHVTTKVPLGPNHTLEGLLIRVPSIPISTQTFRLLGAKPVPIPFHEVYQALQDDVVQAQENPLPAIKAMKFYEVTPVINLTAHFTDAQLIVVDTQVWQAVPAAERAQLGNIFETTGNRVTEDVRKAELRLAKELKEMGAVINPVDRAALAGRIQPYHLDGNTFPWTGDIYTRIQQIKSLP
jgi:TRAP-type C4-dicarboxylate transport system substrate-binding protein